VHILRRRVVEIKKKVSQLPQKSFATKFTQSRKRQNPIVLLSIFEMASRKKAIQKPFAKFSRKTNRSKQIVEKEKGSGHLQ
jgi:hypothetical protein